MAAADQVELVPIRQDHQPDPLPVEAADSAGSTRTAGEQRDEEQHNEEQHGEGPLDRGPADDVERSPSRSPPRPDGAEAPPQHPANGSAGSPQSAPNSPHAPEGSKWWSRLKDILTNRYSKTRWGWLSWELQVPFLALTTLTQCAIVVVVITLAAISGRENGFTRISDATFLHQEGTRLSSLWDKSLLWTALPSLLMSMYKLMFDAILEELEVRQPFVELKRPEGAPPKRSIMLDYRTSNIFWAWVKMFRQRHRLLGSLVLLSLLTTLVAIPLSAHLVVAVPITSNSSASARVLTSFNEANVNSDVDFRPVTDLVTASLVQGGFFAPWSTAEYAVPRLGIEARGMGGSLGATNFSGIVTAHSAELNCRVIHEAESLTIQNGEATGIVTFYDRGCRVSNSVLLSVTTYVQGWVTETCSQAAGYSRISILSLDYVQTGASGHFANVTLLSCIPSYWKTKGELSVSSLDGLESPTRITFSPNHTGRSQLNFHGPWRNLETLLFANSVLDLHATPGESDLGRLIYDYAARKISPASPLASDAIQEATVTVFRAFFSALTALVIEQTTGTNGIIPLTETSNIPRLQVDTVIAVVIVIIVFLSLVCTVSTFIYRKPSILQEEPEGLLSYAGLLQGSHLVDLVSDLTANSPTAAPRAPNGPLPPGTSADDADTRHPGEIWRIVEEEKTFDKDSEWDGNWGMENRRVVLLERARTERAAQMRAAAAAAAAQAAGPDGAQGP